MSLSGNHEYHTRSKDTINADPPDLLSALSKVESTLMQNITNLKDEVIHLKDIVIKNLQDEKKRLKTKVNVLQNKITDLEIQNNNADQHSRSENVEISGNPQSVSNNQLEEKVVYILKAIDVNITSNEIGACHNRKHCLKALFKFKSIDKNAIGIPNTKSFVSENLTPVNRK